MKHHKFEVVKDEPYLEWLRNKPCYRCGAPPRSDPHHVDTRSRDDRAFPVCRYPCHRYYQDRTKLLRDEQWAIAKQYREEYLKEVECMEIDISILKGMTLL